MQSDLHVRLRYFICLLSKSMQNNEFSALISVIQYSIMGMAKFCSQLSDGARNLARIGKRQIRPPFAQQLKPLKDFCSMRNWHGIKKFDYWALPFLINIKINAPIHTLYDIAYKAH